MSKTIDISKIDLTSKVVFKAKTKFFIFLYIGLVFLSFFGLIFRGIELQVNAGSELYDSSLGLSTFKKYIPAQRGLFLDRDLDILAKNYNAYTLYLYNKVYSPEEIIVIHEIAEGLVSENVLKGLEVELASSVYDIKLGENIGAESLVTLADNDEFSSYFYLINQQKRIYSYPKEFSHIIGYTGKTDSVDLEKGYSQFDQIGKYKLEYQLEEDLKGIKGSTYNLDGVENVIPAQSGNNIQLSIDKDWQIALYKIIAKYSDSYNSAGGAGVIIDNSNGDIVSMVSYPGFDANLYVKGISEDDYRNYAQDRKLPLIDKSISLQIAPGSTFKIITAYALLEDGIIDENTTYFSNRCLTEANFDFCEYQKNFYGQMDIVRALYKSSNLFFCSNAMKLEREGRLNKLFEAEELFGLGQKTGVNLVGELPGNIDTPEYKKSNFNLNWYSGDTCNAVIGQGSNTVTPIQLALVAQAIANKGVVYKPNLISKVTDVFGNVIEQSSPIVARNIPMSENTANLINQGMYNVANYWDGTVYPFLGGLPGNMKVKTGTAEASEVLSDGSIHNTTHGWIMGTFEYQDKSYSFSHVLNLGGGGFYVGQISRDFANCLYSDFPDECK